MLLPASPAVSSVSSVISCLNKAPSFVRFLSSRSEVPAALAKTSFMYLEQGVAIEKVHLESAQKVLTRIVFGNQFLFHPSFASGIGDFVSFSIRCIHNQGATIRGWDTEVLLDDQASAVQSNLHYLWKRDVLSYFWSRIPSLTYCSAYFRLSSLLIELANNCGVRYGEDLVLLPLRLNIREMAECIGSTRETASSCINNLKRRDIVSMDQGLWLVKPALLEKRKKCF